MTIISWICRIIVAIILLQTLYFKFTGSVESRYIFTTLMGEKDEWIGRIGSGILELITAVLLLIPATAWIGALLGLGVSSGAIFSHLTKLGFVVKNDRGLLFVLACIVFMGSLITLFINRQQIPIIGQSFT